MADGGISKDWARETEAKFDTLAREGMYAHEDEHSSWP